MFKIVALMGEAGTGKDTIMQNILKKYPNYFNEIISCTTRPMREGEAHGVNYYYLTEEEFLSKQMLEVTYFNNWYYGASYDTLSTDRPNIGVFNPEGVRALYSNPDVDLTLFKIICSDKTRLLRQLNREQHPNVDEIIRRYGADKADFQNLEIDYYTEIENEDEEDLELATHAILQDLGLIEA